MGVVAENAFGLPDDCETVLRQVGPFRSACWVGEEAEMFASGHEMGHVLVWMIPQEASGMPMSDFAHRLLSGMNALLDIGTYG